MLHLDGLKEAIKTYSHSYFYSLFFLNNYNSCIVMFDKLWHIAATGPHVIMSFYQFKRGNLGI